MKRIAIIGGGIAGLSAAWALEKARRAGQEIDFAIYESADQLGGVIQSEIIDGCVVEGGPDSFLTEKPAAAQLCRELGLADQLLPSNDAERKTYIVVNNKLIPLPDGLMFMVPTKLVPTALTRLFSLRTKLRMGLEYLFPPAPATQDESVADMTRRHYGQETVDRLVSPLLSGVYGGNASQLSVRAVLPRMVQMEQNHRSLTRAMLAARKKNRVPDPGAAQAPSPQNPARAGAGSNNPPSLFTTLRGGMRQMIDALAAQLPEGSVHLGTRVHALTRVEPHAQSMPEGGWIVESSFGADPFDGVILALPAWGAASLLRLIDRPLADALSGVPYSSSITATLGYDRDQLTHLPPGFGYLVPATEGYRMLACTFVHAKFAGRVPPDKGLLRCFLGGSGNEALLDASDAALTAAVLQELAEVLHLKAQPNFVRIYRWRQAMAQYGVGHLDRIQLVRDRMAALPGLALAGNAYSGIGVPDCIRTGQEAAASVLRVLQAEPAQASSTAGPAFEQRS
ncbi:MAG TPA: protoporphyrinogen oxidase [Acidobacteriaceae bacterium]|nr:protoporphyrinogen oxidase [Acidobacteriaceae bacterium]